MTDADPEMVLVRRDDLRAVLSHAPMAWQGVPAHNRLCIAVNAEATTVEERISPDTVFEPRCDIQRRFVGPWTTQETP